MGKGRQAGRERREEMVFSFLRRRRRRHARCAILISPVVRVMSRKGARTYFGRY